MVTVARHGSKYKEEQQFSRGVQLHMHAHVALALADMFMTTSGISSFIFISADIFDSPYSLR